MRYFDRNILSAIILGVAAFLTNTALLILVGPDLPFAAGSIFIFCSAGALGFSGTLISAALGVIGTAFLNGDFIEATRILVLAIAMCAASARAPRIPSFVVTLAAWIFVFLPVNLLLLNENNPWINMQMLAELLFSMIAGALLLNNTAWGAITHRPRHTALSNLLMHFMTITASLAMLCMLALQPHDQLSFLQTSPYGPFKSLAFLVFICVALPMYLGWRLALRISYDSQELVPAGEGKHRRAKTFTNLQQDSWMNRTSTNLRASPNPTLPGATEGSLSAVYVEEKPSTTLSPDLGIIALSATGNVTFINRKFRHLANMSNTEALGKQIGQIGLPPALAKHIQDLVDETLAIGPRVTECKLNQLPDKLRFYEVSSKSPEALEGSSLADGPNGVIITLRDITERRAVESHLLKGQKLASLGVLLNNLAHSFNNTLTAIVGQASFARRMTDRDKIDFALGQIIEASQDAGKLVNQLLDFTTTEPGSMQTVDLCGMIKQRLELLKKVVGENYELVLSCPEQRLPIACDPNLVVQALTNLISNSRESYGEKTGPLEITIAKEEIEKEAAHMMVGAKAGNYVRLRVRDFGCGMNAETLGKAFNPLYTTKSAHGHSGLGLSIVHGIVRAHDGFLTMESHPEKGTTVSLYFPLASSPSVTSTKSKSGAWKSAPYDENLSANHESILVVEDEKNVRDLVTTMLKLLGYKVTCCGSVPEALEATKAENFDLYLVDMILPKLSGLELIERLKSDSPKARALVMTGYGAMPSSVDPKLEVIPKPFDIETLSRAVRQALGGASKKQVSGVTERSTLATIN